MNGPGERRPGAAATVAFAAAVFALRFALAVAAGPGVDDESWFLRLTDRVVRGDTLYRDVFFGSTPLAVQISVLAARIAGTEALVLKALFAAISTATALVALRVLRRFGGTGPTLVLGLAFGVYPPQSADQLYGTLALFFLALALDATLAAADAARAGAGARAVTLRIAAAGAAAGLSFASKPNIGVYTLGAVAAGWFFATRGAPRAAGTEARRAAACLGAFAAAAALPLVPVLVSGAWPQFAEYVFVNKQTYLRVAGTPYLETVGHTLERLGPTWYGTVAALLEVPVLAAVPAAVVGLVLAMRRAGPEDRGRLATVCAFLVADAGFMFPRADWIHALHAMPVAMLACAVAWQRLSASVPARIVVATRTAAALALLVALRRQAHPPLSDLAGGDVRWSSRPHHRGVLEPTEPRDGLDELAAALVEDARRGRSPFVLAGQAGRLWLVTGLENPLPYDYPLVSAFGRTGEEQAVGAVEDGRIRVVFVDTHMPDSLVPKRLLACVHARLVRDGTYGDRYERWRAKEDG